MQNESLPPNVISHSEVILKQETELSIARQAIKKLQGHIGTVILSSSSSEELSDDCDNNKHIHSEIFQRDSEFARGYDYKTNVSIKNNLYIICI